MSTPRRRPKPIAYQVVDVGGPDAVRLAAAAISLLSRLSEYGADREVALRTVTAYFGYDLVKRQPRQRSELLLKETV